jgi:hypothetical protein
MAANMPEAPVLPSISGEWRIELPALPKPFDYRTISDVILTVSREFAPEFERLLASAPNTAVTFDIENRHLPIWLGTRPLVTR